MTVASSISKISHFFPDDPFQDEDGWVGCLVVGGPVMIHADGGVMFSLADVVINMPRAAL